MSWQAVFDNPKLARGRVVAVESLRVGDVINYRDHHVQISGAVRVVRRAP